MHLDGVPVPVVTVKVAAARLHLSLAHTRLLCDLGTLIAIKVDGRWWVFERAIETYAPTLRLLPRNAS